MSMTLYPPQQDVVEYGFFELGFSSILSLPTGAGKTTLAEIGMDRALARGERVAYLTPLKALAEEKLVTWRDRWEGRKVGIFTGDYESSTTPVPYRDADILICTFERLDGILRHWQRHLSWLAELGLVVIDEIHLLMDRARGARLEGAISRLRRVNPFCRLIGLSATVSNHAELAHWIEGVSYHSTWRPVELRHEVRRYKRLTDKPGLVIDVVAQTTREGGQTLVFASSRRRSEQLAAAVAAAGFSASHHHAGLGLARRHKIETEFRSGLLACLIATPTLEMGLNLPCQAVVIADNARWNGESFAPLPVWNYLQRAGRSGRPGQDRAGRAVLLAPTWARQLPDYLGATPEPIRSQLGTCANLAEQILIEVVSRSSRTREQLAGAFLPSTLAYRQDSSVTSCLAQCLADMLHAEILREDESVVLHATPVGRIAVRHHLSPATAKHLLHLAEQIEVHALSDFDLLLHHCWDADLQPQLPVYTEVVEALEELIRETPSCLLDAPPPVTIPPRACAAGVLMAVLAWRYIQGDDITGVCERLDVYLNDAEVLRQNLVRLLRASSDVHAAADPTTDATDGHQRERFCGPPLPIRLTRLAMQLEHGLPGDTVYLTRLPGCGGRLARRLVDAGIADLEKLCGAEALELASIPGIGVKRAGAWLEAAEDLARDFLPDPPVSPLPRVRTIATPPNWPRDIDPGRLQRATALCVTRGPRYTYWVSGGAEVHFVAEDSCDCADFKQQGAGWWCKHRLAVRLANTDRMLKQLVTRLSDLRRPPTLAGYLADLTLGRRWHHG